MSMDQLTTLDFSQQLSVETGAEQQQEEKDLMKISNADGSINDYNPEDEAANNGNGFQFLEINTTPKMVKDVSLRRQILVLRQENCQLKETLQDDGDKIKSLTESMKDVETLLYEEKKKNSILVEQKQLQDNLKTVENLDSTNVVSEVDGSYGDENISSQSEESDSSETLDRKGFYEINPQLEEKLELQDFPSENDSVSDDKIDSLSRNEYLQFQVEQLSAQLNKVQLQFAAQQSIKEQENESQDGEEGLSYVQQQNNLLTVELEQWKQNYHCLQSEHKELVHAGDTLQEEYEKLHEERDKLLEKLVTNKDVSKTNIYQLSEKDDLQKAVQDLSHEDKNLEKEFNLAEFSKNNITSVILDDKSNSKDLIDKNLEFKDSISDLVEKTKCLEMQCTELKDCNSQLTEAQALILQELQSLKDKNQKLTTERESVVEDLELSIFENNELKQKLQIMINDYDLLEQEYAQILVDKENAEKISLTQTKETEALTDDNTENTDIQQHYKQMQEEIQSLRCQLAEVSSQGNERDNDQMSHSAKVIMTLETSTQKERQITSLQIHISRLQQQLMESEKHHEDIVKNYRLHLISAIQGHLDSDVKQALYSIIELRSLEEYC